jgi:hypothetical protein
LPAWYQLGGGGAKKSLAGFFSCPSRDILCACNYQYREGVFMKRSFVVSGIVLVLLAALTSYAWAGKTCPAGETCKCVGSKACAYTCAGEGCKFKSMGSGACSFECEKGKCKADAMGSGTVKLKCPGGKCKLSHKGSGLAVLDCPGKGCDMQCLGSGTCILKNCKKGCTLSCLGTGTCKKE